MADYKNKQYRYVMSEYAVEIERFTVRLEKLQGVEHPLLRKTAECVRQVGKAAYQENILERKNYVI